MALRRLLLRERDNRSGGSAKKPDAAIHRLTPSAVWKPTLLLCGEKAISPLMSEGVDTLA
jgi:hypothetical protein